MRIGAQRSCPKGNETFPGMESSNGFFRGKFYAVRPFQTSIIIDKSSYVRIYPIFYIIGKYENGVFISPRAKTNHFQISVHYSKHGSTCAWHRYCNDNFYATTICSGEFPSIPYSNSRLYKCANMESQSIATVIHPYSNSNLHRHANME